MTLMDYDVTSDMMRSAAESWIERQFPGANPDDAAKSLGILTKRTDNSGVGWSKAAHSLMYTTTGGDPRKPIGQVLLAIERGRAGDLIAELRRPDQFGPSARPIVERCDGAYRLFLRCSCRTRFANRASTLHRRTHRGCLMLSRQLPIQSIA